MKEIPLSHFDVTPAQFQGYLSEVQRSHGGGAVTVDDIVVEEICREVAILKDLDHPNITKYFTSFSEGQYIYIVMELLEGASLADFILSQSEKVSEFLRMTLEYRSKGSKKRSSGASFRSSARPSGTSTARRRSCTATWRPRTS